MRRHRYNPPSLISRLMNEALLQYLELDDTLKPSVSNTLARDEALLLTWLTRYFERKGS